MGSAPTQVIAAAVILRGDGTVLAYSLAGTAAARPIGTWAADQQHDDVWFVTAQITSPTAIATEWRTRLRWPPTRANPTDERVTLLYASRPLPPASSGANS